MNEMRPADLTPALARELTAYLAELSSSPAPLNPSMELREWIAKQGGVAGTPALDPESVAGLRRQILERRLACPELTEIQEFVRYGARASDACLSDEDRFAISSHMRICVRCSADRERIQTLCAPAGVVTGEQRARDDQDCLDPEKQRKRCMRELSLLRAKIQAWDPESCLTLSDYFLDRIGEIEADLIDRVSHGKEDGDRAIVTNRVDRLLARKMLQLRAGDTYQTVTRIDFFRKGLSPQLDSMVHTEFHRASVVALLSGVRIQRIVPLHTAHHTDLMRILAIYPKRPDRLLELQILSDIASESTILSEHISLAKEFNGDGDREPAYQLRFVIVTGDEREEVLNTKQHNRFRSRFVAQGARVRHFGLCQRSGGIQAFLPTYDHNGALHGLSFPSSPERVAALALDFADLWGGAYGLRDLHSLPQHVFNVIGRTDRSNRSSGDSGKK